MDVKTLGIVGTGQMATGIAEVAAKAGVRTIVRGRKRDRADACLAAVTKSLDRAVEKGKATTEDRDSALGMLDATADIHALADVDLVIECASEDLDLKKELFRQIDIACDNQAILSSVTSSLPIIQLAMVTERPTKVVGLHFFNPAPLMSLVEIVPTLLTDADVVDTCKAFTEKVGKNGVLAKDRAGFIVNALLFPYLNQAVRMFESGYASREDIDTAMKGGCGHPMGPLQVLDLVGLDTSLEILESLYTEFRDPSVAPAPLLRQMVLAGLLGRKTKRGFYEY